MFPLSNWTELDVWNYIEREGIELPSIYYAHERDVFERDGMLLAVGPYSQPRSGEAVERRGWFATGPSATCPAPARSRRPLRPPAEVVVEVAASELTERGATRADDRVSEAAMEDRKREGYF